jgi:hypothetical protein
MRGQLLDGLIAASGYNRKYAIALLNRAPQEHVPAARNRSRVYGKDVQVALKQIWIAANCICAKRFVPFLPSLIESMERFGHLELSKRVRKKLLCMSVSTADRLLRAERKRLGRGRSLTRPGSLLRKQVAVKTFSRWDDQAVGFLEADLVAHCGDNVSGQFVNTLTMTDVATGWTELAALECKSEELVRRALDEAIGVLPFPLLGLDTDNGTEFLNHGLVSWCNARHITFTRSRAYRKNDQAHVEEKNGSIVRRLVGYDRFEGSKARKCLAELYRVSRLYINFFQPSMKLISKVRDGAKVSKKYDESRTPFERLMRSNTLSNKLRKDMDGQFRELDPMALLVEMARMQKKLWRHAVLVSGDGASKTAIVTPAEGVPLHAKRKKKFHVRREGTRTGQILERILSLPKGTPVEASDFYEFGTIHFVNVVLHKLCEQDQILARYAWGKYMRIDSSEANTIQNVRRKLRNKTK